MSVMNDRTLNALMYAACVLERLDGEALREIEKRPPVPTPAADLLRRLPAEVDYALAAAARLQGWRDGCADAAAVIEAMAKRAQGSGSPRKARIWDAAASVARALPEPDYSEEGDQ